VKQENTLVIDIEGNPSSLDPRFASDAYSERICGLLYNGLFRINEKGEIEPDIVESWKKLNDRTFEFNLKRGIRFHNGKELTSDDVIYTYNSIITPSTGSPLLSSFSEISGIEKIDNYTIRIKLKSPFAPIFFTLRTGIIPYGSDEGNTIGTGPFKLKEWARGSSIILQRFSEYFRSSPKIEHIKFKVIPNPITRVLELRKGNTDLLFNAIPHYAIDEVKEIKNIEVVNSPGVTYCYLGINLHDVILSKQKVRQAIAYGINREKIIRFFFKDYATKSTGVLSPLNWAYEGNVKKYEYNPEIAKKLLDEAGYLDPDGDGPEMRFFLEYKTSEERNSVRLAEIISEELRRIGIGIKIKSYEWGTFFSDIRNNNFQLYSLRWTGVLEPDIYYYLFHSKSVPPSGANRGYYTNFKLDELLEKGRRTYSKEERKEIYSRIQKILADDLPYINLWYLDDVVIKSRQLGGFKIYPGGELYSLENAYFKPDNL
jgi:peptide/nickel transport system substrate-binding protein